MALSKLKLLYWGFPQLIDLNLEIEANTADNLLYRMIKMKESERTLSTSAKLQSQYSTLCISWA